MVKEYIRCPLHAKLGRCRFLRQDVLLLSVQSLVRLDVASLDHELLQLEEVELDVLVLLQELVLAAGVLELEVLQSNVINSSLLINLQ